jgi:3-oxoacyl-[acyl-carrier-protein] synthase-3
MLYKNVILESMGVGIPPEIVSSAEIESRLEPLYSRLKLPPGRLEIMSGIKERRLWPVGSKPSDTAIIAGKDALSKTEVPLEEIKCLIMCSVCRDFLEPATATVVHNALGLPRDSLVFDISNACLGVLTGMLCAANMIELGQISAGMVVAGENGRALLEHTIKILNEDPGQTRRSIKKHFSSLTIGSGSFAAILSSSKLSSQKHRLLGAVSTAATEHNKLCRGNDDAGMLDGSEVLMNTDSETLMIKGVETAFETWEKFKKELAWTNSSPDIICAHQVGSAHRKMLFEKLGLPLDKDFPILESFGNTGSASCPSTLGIAAKTGKIQKGNKVAMLGIGSGINCTMLGVEW